MLNTHTPYHRYLTATLMATIMIVLASCHSARTPQRQPSATVTDSRGLNDTWHDVQMPVKVVLNKPMSMSMSGRATMVRDSLVNISMRVFGMEVAVAMLTPDSLYLVDKYHHYFFAEPLTAITGKHRLSAGDVQKIILGQSNENPLRFNNAGAEGPVVVTMADFVATLAGDIASNVTINAPLRTMDIDAELLWSPKSAKFDTYPSVTFKYPGSKYKRITPADIKYMFSNL